MKDTEKGSDSVRSVDRALKILLAFTPNDYELSATELLKRVDLSRATLYRLLYTLEENGFLISVGEPQRFRLGASVSQLAHVWTSSIDLSVIAQPVMQDIWRKTQETVALFIPQDAIRLCVAELPSPQPLSFKRGVGHSELVGRGASGRAILAAMSLRDDQRREYARQAGVTVKALDAELKSIRERGYAVSRNELIQGAVALAVAFFNRDGKVAGSLALYGPETRLNDKKVQELGACLLMRAKDLSDALGYRGADLEAESVSARS